MTVYIPVLIGLLALSAFFSSAETAFLSLDQVRLEHAARDKRSGAGRVRLLLGAPRRLLSAILLGNNLVNTGAAAVGTVIAADIVSGGSGVVAATLAVTVLLVLFGEMGPKSVALHHNLAVARAYAIPLAIWLRLTRPAVAALDGLAGVLLSLLGERSDSRPALSLGELRTAIHLGAESGALEQEESSMLLGALKLQATQVRRIMTPRMDMVAADAGDPLPDLAERLSAAGFLRLPVYSGAPDNIVGYVHVGDVSAAYAHGRTSACARDVMREVSFESERASIARVLEQMQASGSHMVILIDEFGTTSGLVTLEDIMEAVVGQIQSESGPKAADVDVRVGPRLYVEGRRSLSDLSADLGAPLADGEPETVAGLLLAHFRHIPERGEFMDQHGFRFTVMGADERRVTLVAVEPLDEGGEDAPGQDAAVEE